MARRRNARVVNPLNSDFIKELLRSVEDSEFGNKRPPTREAGANISIVPTNVYRKLGDFVISITHYMKFSRETLPEAAWRTYNRYCHLVMRRRIPMPEII